MANDPPTSLRMGFGYYQARAAGLDGLREARSPRQVNRLIKDARAYRAVVDYLRKKARDPNWAALIKHRIDEGCNVSVIEEEIYWIDRYAAARNRGCSLELCLRYH
jgi:hypothetical protein